MPIQVQHENIGAYPAYDRRHHRIIILAFIILIPLPSFCFLDIELKVVRCFVGCKAYDDIVWYGT